MRHIHFYAGQPNLKIKVYNKINLHTENNAQALVRLKLPQIGYPKNHVFLLQNASLKPMVQPFSQFEKEFEQ